MKVTRGGKIARWSISRNRQGNLLTKPEMQPLNFQGVPQAGLRHGEPEQFRSEEPGRAASERLPCAESLFIGRTGRLRTLTQVTNQLDQRQKHRDDHASDNNSQEN